MPQHEIRNTELPRKAIPNKPQSIRINIMKTE